MSGGRWVPSSSVPSTWPVRSASVADVRERLHEHFDRHPSLSGPSTFEQRAAWGEELTQLEDLAEAIGMHVRADSVPTSRPVRWTTVNDSLHTATGPNREAIRVVKRTEAHHKWSVHDHDGQEIASGISPTVEKAKKAATAVVL